MLVQIYDDVIVDISGYLRYVLTVLDTLSRDDTFWRIEWLGDTNARFDNNSIVSVVLMKIYTPIDVSYIDQAIYQEFGSIFFESAHKLTDIYKEMQQLPTADFYNKLLLMYQIGTNK